MTRTCLHCGADIAHLWANVIQCRACSKVKQSIIARTRHRIARGELPELDGSVACVDCGAPAAAYEHRDYTKPDDVQPVCRSCNHARGPGHLPAGFKPPRSDYRPRGRKPGPKKAKRQPKYATPQQASRAVAQKMNALIESSHSRIVIEGKGFETVHAAWQEAVRRGFDGAESVFSSRMLRRAHTWAELTQPINPNIAAARKAVAQRKRDEMAEVLRQLDERKRALAPAAELRKVG